MRRFCVTPLEGVSPITLGATRQASRREMGQAPKPFEKVPGSIVDAYYDSSFQVFFDDDETVEYIELSRSKNQIVELFGQSVFEQPGADLLESLPCDLAMTSDDGGYSYISQQYSLSLWRPLLPQIGGTEGHFFETIGVGIAGYFSAEVEAWSR
ncbi:MAG: hypothetical protein AAGH76_08790 [Pseudomonadota bacterium]